MLLGVSASRSAMLLSVLGLSSVVSRLLVGWVADQPRVDSVVLYTGALLVAGASTCTLPSLRSYQLLCGYQIVYGACCGICSLSRFCGPMRAVGPLCVSVFLPAISFVLNDLRPRYWLAGSSRLYRG